MEFIGVSWHMFIAARIVRYLLFLFSINILSAEGLVVPLAQNIYFFWCHVLNTAFIFGSTTGSIGCLMSQKKKKSSVLTELV